jgi:hypothetical protein
MEILGILTTDWLLYLLNGQRAEGDEGVQKEVSGSKLHGYKRKNVRR